MKKLIIIKKIELLPIKNKKKTEREDMKNKFD